MKRAVKQMSIAREDHSKSALVQRLMVSVEVFGIVHG